jgi:hypothetical protein
MMDETSEGRFQLDNQLGQGNIGIKDPQNFTNQQSGYQEPSYQNPVGPPPGPYYPPGAQTRFPMIPVSPYSKGLAISVVLMIIGALVEKVFTRIDYYYYEYINNPFYYLGMVIFYIGGILAFLFTLGLFLLPPRQDQTSKESSNVHLGLAFLMGAIVIALAHH